jgi:hypothetical protein
VSMGQNEMEGVTGPVMFDGFFSHLLFIKPCAKFGNAGGIGFYANRNQKCR